MIASKKSSKGNTEWGETFPSYFATLWMDGHPSLLILCKADGDLWKLCQNIFNTVLNTFNHLL